MKKLISLLVNAILIIGTVFATTYKVDSVKGIAQKVKGGQTYLEVGQEISGDEIIKVGVNSILVLENEKGEKVTIKTTTPKNADELFILLKKSPKKGISTSKTIKHTEIAGPIEGTSKGTATASTRASEAKEDIEWDE